MDNTSKRVAKCTGCKTPLEEHHWGIPSKFCDGFEKSSPRKDVKDASIVKEEDVMASLTEELKALEMEEQALRRQQSEERLRTRIAEKRKVIKELQESKSQQGNYRAGTFTTRELAKLELDAAVGQQTPLDELLKTIDPVQDGQMDGATWAAQPAFNRAPQGGQGTQAWQTTQAWQSIPQPWQALQSNTEMFLKPGRMAKGEKPLLIIDFVNNIVPQDEEETLGTQGNAKIVVTYGPKKPKLENISLQQWVVANTRIFYTLLSQGKLVNQVDIQNYLAYTVKIMELSSKYEWRSVLLYDNEFRKLQAIYSFSWSFDSPHLHTVMLQPIFKATIANKTSQPNPPSTRTSFASYTSEGRVICRNFNGPKGCTLQNCNFAHVCNRKVAGKACGLGHPGYSHKLDGPQNTQTSS